MSDAVFQRSPAVGRLGTIKRAARPPPGYGLAFGAAASVGLWAGLFWIAARVFS